MLPENCPFNYFDTNFLQIGKIHFSRLLCQIQDIEEILFYVRAYCLMTETRFDGFIFVTSCRMVKSVNQNVGTLLPESRTFSSCRRRYTTGYLDKNNMKFLQS